jgi:hypothetical protein
MRWFGAALVLMVSTGCPSDFGKGGRVDRASHKDSLELVRKHCSQQEYDEACGGDRKYTQGCRDACGE